MKSKTVGELLRETRVQKNLTLGDVEKATKIPTHHLLALELDQFKIITKDQINHYLQSYAKATDLNAEELLKLYRNQLAQPEAVHANPIAKRVEEKLSVQNTQKEPVYSTKLKKQEPKQEVSKKNAIENRVVKETHISNQSRDELPTDIIKESRLSRHRADNEKKSALPVIVLCLLTLAILSFIFYFVWQQLKSEQKTKEPASSLVSSAASQDQQASDSSQAPSSSASIVVSTEGQGNTLAVTLANTSSVKINIGYSGQERSWISVTNTENGSDEVTLTPDNNSLTTTLAADATSSTITLGITQGISITINDQPLDLSALTSTDLSYITLTKQGE
ncbi:helix-turn-helix domain-containing protein [Streptococcus caballi]|uniref:helix-turn-helix domain-containing protein n=1 Tax=Streptococcus caballi TaxID=439220 RepID=UPI000378C29D|nr:helix-turn-helix domain-containing protein [Streptococcus caballi]